jgi:hypothetical protein
MPLRRLGGGRLGVSAEGVGAHVQIVVNNYSSARVTQREQSDGRGGRRVELQIEDMMTATATRPGSRFTRAVAASGGMTRL